MRLSELVIADAVPDVLDFVVEGAAIVNRLYSR